MDNDKNREIVEIDENEISNVIGGMRSQNTMCSCGRGQVYKDGMCRHCYQLKDNK